MFFFVFKCKFKFIFYYFNLHYLFWLTDYKSKHIIKLVFCVYTYLLVIIYFDKNCRWSVTITKKIDKKNIFKLKNKTLKEIEPVKKINNYKLFIFLILFLSNSYFLFRKSRESKHLHSFILKKTCFLFFYIGKWKKFI